MSHDHSEMTTARFLRLEYKASPRALKWQRSSLTKHNTPESRALLECEAPAIALQNGWTAWRIVEES